MSRNIRKRSVLLGVALPAALLALAACGPKAPPAPLLSPIAETKGNYGYSERVIGRDRVEISYFAPIRRMPPSAVYRAPFAQRSIDLAADLALWRAAQLARARNVARFTVDTRRTEVVVDRYQGGYRPDPFFGPTVPYYYRYRGPYFYPTAYPFAYYSYDPPSAQGRAVVRIEVYFGIQPGRRSQTTSDVISRMSRKYGPATATPARAGGRAP